MPCFLFSLFLQRRHPLQKDYFHRKPFFSDNRVKLRQTDTLSTNPRSPLEALIDVVPFDGMSMDDINNMDK